MLRISVVGRASELQSSHTPVATPDLPMLYKLAALAALLDTVSGAASSSDSSSSSSSSSSSAASSASSCYSLKAAYQSSTCCNANLAKETTYTVAHKSTIFPGPGPNPCAGKQPATGFDNKACFEAGITEQAGANVTAGYQGLMDVSGRVPITSTYLEAGLCPVNVHWHLGTEHLSVGEFDENGSGPSSTHRRKLGTNIRSGFQCHHYDSHDAKFTTPFNWQHCTNMEVGQTYEVHWPHSAAGACGTPDQYQSPFYDGVFCRDGIISLDPLNTYQKIGVQSQTFTIVNDEDYYYPDLMRGMIVEGDFGADMAKYTGSTTGTSRSNEICSTYTPITWQVDRKCHLISASTFDKMCADMKSQRDDMSSDFYPHGSRELVADHLAANNQQRK